MTNKSRKCVICKINTAEWVMQELEYLDFWFSVPGWQYRGFKGYHVCDECKGKIRGLDSIQLKNLADSLHSVAVYPLG